MMKLKSQLKNSIASAFVAGSLMLSSPASADSLGGWMQIVGSSVGGVMSYLSLKKTPVINFLPMINFDAIQVALEILVLDAMKDVTDKWDPEPKDSYQSAAQNNDDGARADMKTILAGKDGSALSFEVQSLSAVGVESVGLTNLTGILGGRPTLISQLSKMKTDASNLLPADTTSDSQLTAIMDKQNQNYQWLSTAGVARAELGLKAAYQASIDAGADASVASNANASQGTSDNEVQMAAQENYVPNQTLTQLPASVTSTAQAMSVQALMNMELAQRLNLSNSLQSNILSLEAARALRNAGVRRNN